ncbi:MAG: 7TM diverse intracellular signaling domain-containing protein [Leptospira sp.]|nr:7TM diverse intracellular signaling domain-containing protein [Leptospira sp.]
MDLSTIDWENQIPVNLSYPWEFYWQKLYEPKDFEIESVFDRISEIESFRPWTYHKVGNEKLQASGFATYRFKVKVQDQNQPRIFSIFYHNLHTSSKLFVNGKMVHETGKVSNDLDKMIPLRSNTSVDINTNENYLDIILQISNSKFYLGGPRAEFLLGSFKQIQLYQIKTIMVEMFVFGLIFGSFVYHLFFFLLNRSQHAFLFFSIICFTFLMRIPFLNSKMYEYVLPTFSFEKEMMILHFINILSFMAGNLFLNTLFQRKKFSFINYIFYFGALGACFSPLIDGRHRYYLNLLYLIIFLLFFLLHSFLLLYLNKKNRESYYLMGIGLFSLAIFCFLSISLNFLGIQGGLYLILGYLIYVIFQSLSLGKYFTYAIESRSELEFKMAEENMNALAKQRSDMQIMMHDNLGADLTDLKVYLEKQSRNLNFIQINELLPQLQYRVISIIKSLRNQLLSIEDLNLTYENFLTGLNLTLLRRYFDAGREFDFNISEKLSSTLQSVHLKSNNRIYFLDIYYMLYELCTNDLKYGFGESIWRLDLVVNEIRIYQTNQINEESENKFLSLKSIGNRLQKLEGKVNSQIKDNVFIAEIFIPYASNMDLMKNSL